MFNSPILDVAIGIIFIFLLYSLLATSIKEGIATLFGLRARMLKKGIIEGMLSATTSSKDTTQKSTQLGKAFYQHPVIKNYGANKTFDKPSYISRQNFSGILIDVLKQYAEAHKEGIADYAKKIDPTFDFDKASDITKLDYLIKYLLNTPVGSICISGYTIDKETLEILQLYISKCYHNIEAFTASLETWFDDSMDRVSGWYKRQVQFILFTIGLILAFAFNVNIIRIAGKLSTDKDARDKLVAMAIKEVDNLKNDPRVIQLKKDIESKNKDTIIPQDSITAKKEELADIVTKAKNQKEAIVEELNHNVKDANNLLALGWDDYGFKKDKEAIISKYQSDFNQLYDSISEADCDNYTLAVRQFDSIFKPAQAIKDSVKTTSSLNKEAKEHMKKVLLEFHDTDARKQKAYKKLFECKEYQIKLCYIFSNFWKGSNLLGYLLLAIGVCLGAPFWFDLLQKLIKVRGSGKKEETADNTPVPAAVKAPPASIIVNNSTNQEAIG